MYIVSLSISHIKFLSNPYCPKIHFSTHPTNQVIFQVERLELRDLGIDPGLQVRFGGFFRGGSWQRWRNFYNSIWQNVSFKCPTATISLIEVYGRWVNNIQAVSGGLCQCRFQSNKELLLVNKKIVIIITEKFKYIAFVIVHHQYDVITIQLRRQKQEWLWEQQDRSCVEADVNSELWLSQNKSRMPT